MSTEITIRAATLQEPDLKWHIWALILLAGFTVGATLDLFSLWLFAHWMHK